MISGESGERGKDIWVRLMNDVGRLDSTTGRESGVPREAECLEKQRRSREAEKRYGETTGRERLGSEQTWKWTGD